MRALIIVCALVLSSLPAGASLNRRTPVVEAVEKVTPAVVNIGTERMVRTMYSDRTRQFRGDVLDEWLRDMFGTPPTPGYRLSHSLGSGVIVDPAGYILTNYHVIERASRIRVLLADQQVLEAVFLAGDEVNDLALIKVDPETPLTAVAFAKDDDLILGEPVIAMGNPFGLAHTVTVGVLSAKNREFRWGGEVLYRDILQTDAAINFGSSGGPLLNVDGELIGINVAVSAQGQNIGFAVPIKRCRALLARWLSPRLLHKTWLGFTPSMSEEGLLVDGVDPEGPAAAAGVKNGDVVKALNAEPLADLFDFNKHLVGVQLGDEVDVTIARADGEQTVKLPMVALPKPSGDALAKNLLGVTFANLEGRTDVHPIYRSGLPLAEVTEKSMAAERGLRPGLIVTKINGFEIKSIDDVGLALEQVQKGDIVNLDVVRLSEKDAFLLAQQFSAQVIAM